MLMRFWAGHVPLMSVQVILFYSKANYKQYSFSILFIVVTLSYCPLWEEISTLMVHPHPLDVVSLADELLRFL